MKAKLFLIAASVLLVVSIYLYWIIGYTTASTGQATNINSQSMARFTQLFASGLPGIMGIIFFIAGFKHRSRDLREKKLREHILLTGISAKAKITYIDKNWTIRINKRYIYSIVEYTYKDKVGKEYTMRFNNISSELAVRKGLQVGGSLPIKYDSMDASKSAIDLSL